MKEKDRRLETLKMIISSKELGSQEEVLKNLHNEGFMVTQATLSRDLKRLKVAKAASMNGNYVYVLPNETMYKRVKTQASAEEMLQTPGFISVNYAGNICIIKTRPGYASIIAYNIDNANLDGILGTIAGDDTILTVFKSDISYDKITERLKTVIPEIEDPE